MKMRLADAGVVRRLERDHQRWTRSRWYYVALVVAYAVIQGRFLFMTAFHRLSQNDLDSLRIVAAKNAFISGFLLALLVTSLILEWQNHLKINRLLEIIKRSESEK